MSYTTPALAQRTMGASLASESRLSRFGGPARRVVSMPDEEKPAREGENEAPNAAMSPISGEGTILRRLTSDAHEDQSLRCTHGSAPDDQSTATPPHRLDDPNFAAKPAQAPRSPPQSSRRSPPPLSDTGRDNWLVSHPKADTAKRKGGDPEPSAHRAASSHTNGHPGEVRPLRASRPAPAVSSVHVQDNLHTQHPHNQSPQVLPQHWGQSQPEAAAKLPAPGPPQAVPKKSFLVSGHRNCYADSRLTGCLMNASGCSEREGLLKCTLFSVQQNESCMPSSG